MSSLTDLIEEYITELIEQGGGIAELQRVLIANHFRCAPSQVTYVISSRFSPERGYIVESRRGGGGYIRVERVSIKDENVESMIRNAGEYMTQDEAYHYLERLLTEGYLDQRTYRVIRSALSRNVLSVNVPVRDLIRANLFKSMLNSYFGLMQRK
jgi:transcriptional regulator CtsR